MSSAQPPSPPPYASRIAELPSREPGLRIHYLYAAPPPNVPIKGTFLLIHGFPYTSYHYRHVLGPLAAAGYRAVAPDYRGAGKSSKPRTSPTAFLKTTMAADLLCLLRDELGLFATDAGADAGDEEQTKGGRADEKIHVVGHDIGATVAHAFAARHPQHVASVALGECVLPGTREHAAHKALPDHFHLAFHSVPDLPEALIAGREHAYCARFFFDRQACNRAALAEAEAAYARDYAAPGALRCAMEAYRAFEDDGVENVRCVERDGRCAMRALALSGARSLHAREAVAMLGQVYESVEAVEMEGVGHYLAEEDPAGFVKVLVEWAGRDLGM